MTAHPVLDHRALNRATLERQFLLERVSQPVPETLEHLVGLQAQAPDAPYIGLWSRLTGFDADQLARLIASREAVRVPLMRATVHLVTAADHAALYPWARPVLERSFASQQFARNLEGVDLAAVTDAAADLLAASNLTRAKLGAALAEIWPGRDPISLAYAVTYLLPVVQVPPRGIWGERGPARWSTTEAWIGRPKGRPLEPGPLLGRYLAAFGPASVRDAQMWSGLTRLQEVADDLGAQLRRFRDEDGRELLDLPDGPLPDPGTPAPPRFLPEYDNVLLSYASRARILTGNRAIPLPPGNGGTRGTVLVDGFFAGIWHAARNPEQVTLHIETFEPLTKADASAVTEEGLELLAFIAPQLASMIVLSVSGAAAGAPSARG
ncbi:MAG: winged helix DNA-binding domain-containing protein [Actinomycetota bacterium]